MPGTGHALRRQWPERTGLSAEDDVVELHVVSDATGETATRVVAATEAQFPDQPFVTVRHPRVETVADLQLALARMEGRRAVVIFTIVEPTLRSVMRELCDEAEVDYCDLLAEPLAAVAKVSGRKAELRPGARPPLDESYFKRIAAIEFAVKNDDGLGRAPRRRRRRPRRRLAHLEDAALDLPRLPRLEGDERPAREGDRPAAGALRDRPDPDRRADDRRATGSRRSAPSGSS